MEVSEIYYTNRFEKQYNKLSKRLKTQAIKKEKLFRENPFHPSLETHKLKGKKKEVWSFSVTGNYRIKFLFLDEGNILFLEVGTHDIYK